MFAPPCRLSGDYVQVKVLDWQTHDYVVPLTEDVMSDCVGFKMFAREKIDMKFYLNSEYSKHPYLGIVPKDGLLTKLRSRLTIILHLRDFEPPLEHGFIRYVLSSVPAGSPWDKERMMNRDMGQFADKKKEAIFMTANYFIEAGTSVEGLLKQANEPGRGMT
jgi:hypothetical protein